MSPFDAPLVYIELPHARRTGTFHVLVNAIVALEDLDDAGGTRLHTDCGHLLTSVTRADVLTLMAKEVNQ